MGGEETALDGIAKQYFEGTYRNIPGSTILDTT